MKPMIPSTSLFNNRMYCSEKSPQFKWRCCAHVGDTHLATTGSYNHLVAIWTDDNFWEYDPSAFPNLPKSTTPGSPLTWEWSWTKFFEESTSMASYLNFKRIELEKMINDK